MTAMRTPEVKQRPANTVKEACSCKGNVRRPVVVRKRNNDVGITSLPSCTRQIVFPSLLRPTQQDNQHRSNEQVFHMAIASYLSFLIEARVEYKA